MKISTFSAFSGLIFSVAGAASAAENIVLGKLLFDANAPVLSEAEARDFFKPGSEVETFAPSTSSVRRWVNDASGKFIASRQGGTGNAKSQGSGEWKVSDNGQYCVVIEWKTARGSPDTAENWCRVVYRFDGETYLAPRDLAANVDKKYSVVRIK